MCSHLTVLFIYAIRLKLPAENRDIYMRGNDNGWGCEHDHRGGSSCFWKQTLLAWGEFLSRKGVGDTAGQVPRPSVTKSHDLLFVLDCAVLGTSRKSYLSFCLLRLKSCGLFLTDFHKPPSFCLPRTAPGSWHSEQLGTLTAGTRFSLLCCPLSKWVGTEFKSPCPCQNSPIPPHPHHGCGVLSGRCRAFWTVEFSNLLKCWCSSLG